MLLYIGCLSFRERLRNKSFRTLLERILGSYPFVSTGGLLDLHGRWPVIMKPLVSMIYPSPCSNWCICCSWYEVTPLNSVGWNAVLMFFVRNAYLGYGEFSRMESLFSLSNLILITGSMSLSTFESPVPKLRATECSSQNFAMKF